MEDKQCTGFNRIMITTEMLNNIPRHVGVYLMKNSRGQVLYVGKAQNLSSRVRSYFTGAGDNRPQVSLLVRKVADIECILTNNEKEALVLEDNLIKKYHPRYNVMLRDDKSFLSIRINLKEKYPRPQIVRFREVKDDRARYFGPYSSARSIRDTLKLIQRIFPVRSCSNTKFAQHKTRPCLECQINRCIGPCCRPVSERQYRQVIDDVIMFLEGKNTQLLQYLRRQMQQESDRLNFEEAQRLLRQIQAIEHVVEAQQVVTPSKVNQDIYGLYRQADEVLLQVMHIRGGAFSENTIESFSRIFTPDDEIISSFMTQFYLHGAYIPDEILLPLQLSDSGPMTELLSERKGKKVSIIAPQRGAKKRLIDMAARNAENRFISAKDESAMRERTLEIMQSKLRLAKPPVKIECFDISNIMGTSAVASMVVFVDGKKEKSLYRRYRIKTISQPDDYAMMKQVLTRRYTRAVAENDLPDLIIIDGGKGQLNICLDILKRLELSHLNVISIAKDKTPWAESRNRAEKIYLPRVKDPVTFKTNSPALFLIQRIRDEAHRFAITYHQKLRKKSTLRSIIDDIPGIGPKRKQSLLKHFGSLKKISLASIQQIQQVPGITPKLARLLHENLNRTMKTE